MKKAIMMMAVIAASLQVNAQRVSEYDVPKPTTAGFFKAHPTAKDVEWTKEGVNYVGKYEMEKVKMYSTYSDEGKFLEDGMDIVQAALPTPVMDYIKFNYKEDEVKSACKISNSYGMTSYLVEVKDMNLTFDSKGNYVKSVKKM